MRGGVGVRARKTGLLFLFFLGRCSEAQPRTYTYAYTAHAHHPNPTPTAVGSSAQISLFVVPFIVIFGWIKDIDMTLNFPPFEIMLYVLSIVIVTNCVSNGKSNWLEGSLLITTYVMIAVGFWYEKVVSFR